MTDIINRLLEKFGYNEIVFNSCLNPALDVHGDNADILFKFINRKPTKVVLEIGTYHGLSAAYIATFIEKVYTIDLMDYEEKYKFWDFLGVTDRIKFIKVKDDNEKREVIESIHFDLAFVDGEHFKPYPEVDFEMVKHCGRVILHDYCKEFPDVIEFCDKLNSKERNGLFVYWEDSLSPQVLMPEFHHNLHYVNQYLVGAGFDMGCGSNPLQKPNCYHVEVASKEMSERQLGRPIDNYIHEDASSIHGGLFYEKVDYVFSSHMIEDLGSEEEIVKCLKNWSTLLKDGGHIILLLPDMQGGRYPTVEEGGNPSHRVNVGAPFIKGILSLLPSLNLVQMDTIPHNEGCTIDVVFRKDQK